MPHAAAWVLQLQHVFRLAGLEVRRLREPVDPLPMVQTWLERLEYWRQRIEQIAAVPGAVVECGVASGRSLMFLAYWLAQEPVLRRLVGFDSFLPYPPDAPEDRGGRRFIRGDGGGNTPASVRRFLSVTGIPDAMLVRVELIPGWFAQTLPRWQAPIALLHIDADFAQSIREVLQSLAPHVVPGGLICFDDYQEPRWPGATHVIDAWMQGRSERLVVALPKTAYLIKQGKDQHAAYIGP